MGLITEAEFQFTAAADFAAFASDCERNKTAIFYLLKRCSGA